MSPEQFERSGLDVDTRADIYMLGVLLYELLTGGTPLDQDRLREADFDEVRQSPWLVLGIPPRIADAAVRRDLLRAIHRAYPDQFRPTLALARDLHYGLPPRVEEAVRYYTAALALRPHHPLAAVDLGNAPRALGDLPGAIRAFRDAVDNRPTYGAAHERLALALDANGDLDGAIAHMRETTSLRQFVPDYNHLGNMLSRKGLFDEAVAAYQAGLQVDPIRAIAHNRGSGYDLGCVNVCLAIALFNQSKFDEAADAMDRSCQVDPENPDRWYLAALMRAALADSAGHRRVCRDALDRFSASPDRRTADIIPRACLLSPDVFDAPDFAHVQALAKLAGESAGRPTSVTTSCLANLRAGRHREALESLTRLPANAGVAYRDVVKFSLLAIAHQALGNNAEAKAALVQAETLLADMPDPAAGRYFRIDDWSGWQHARIFQREAEKAVRDEG